MRRRSRGRGAQCLPAVFRNPRAPQVRSGSEGHEAPRSMVSSTCRDQASVTATVRPLPLCSQRNVWPVSSTVWTARTAAFASMLQTWATTVAATATSTSLRIVMFPICTLTSPACCASAAGAAMPLSASAEVTATPAIFLRCVPLFLEGALVWRRARPTTSATVGETLTSCQETCKTTRQTCMSRRTVASDCAARVRAAGCPSGASKTPRAAVGRSAVMGEAAVPALRSAAVTCTVLCQEWSALRMLNARRA